MPDIATKDIARWFAAAPVVWREAHDPQAQGRVTRAGFHVDPYCHPGCCRPDGPFPTHEAAAMFSRDEQTGHALLNEAERLTDAP